MRQSREQLKVAHGLAVVLQVEKNATSIFRGTDVLEGVLRQDLDILLSCFQFSLTLVDSLEFADLIF